MLFRSKHSSSLRRMEGGLFHNRAFYSGVSVDSSHHTFYSAALQGYKSLKNCNLRHRRARPFAEVVPPGWWARRDGLNGDNLRGPRSRGLGVCKSVGQRTKINVQYSSR